MDELKEMQCQIDTLRNTLNQKSVVNDLLLKKIISKSVGSLNRIVWVECVAFPLSLLILTAFCVAMDITLWLVAFIAFFGSIDLAMDFRNIRISPQDLASRSLIEIRSMLLRQKKRRLIQNCIMAPIAAVWVIWFFIESIRPFEFSGEARVTVWCILGVVLIATLGIVLYLVKRVDGTTDGMIREIDLSEND